MINLIDILFYELFLAWMGECSFFAVLSVSHFISLLFYYYMRNSYWKICCSRSRWIPFFQNLASFTILLETNRIKLNWLLLHWKAGNWSIRPFNLINLIKYFTVDNVHFMGVFLVRQTIACSFDKIREWESVSEKSKK